MRDASDPPLFQKKKKKKLPQQKSQPDLKIKFQNERENFSKRNLDPHQTRLSLAFLVFHLLVYFPLQDALALALI